MGSPVVSKFPLAGARVDELVKNRTECMLWFVPFRINIIELASFRDYKNKCVSE